MKKFLKRMSARLLWLILLPVSPIIVTVQLWTDEWDSVKEGYVEAWEYFMNGGYGE